MQRLCPKCQNWFSSQLLCPSCNVQLLDPSREDAKPRPFRTKNPLATPITGWGRLLLGVAIAQLVFHASRHLVVGVAELWPSTRLVRGEDGAATLFALRAAGVLLASVLVGAGHPRPVALGLALGILNAILFLVSGGFLGETVSEQLLIGEAIGSLAIGVIGATMGSRAWKAFPPVHPISDPSRLLAMDVQAKSQDATWNRRRYRVQWLRVMLGAMVATAGAYWAADARDWFTWFSRAKFQPGSLLQSQFIDWEMAALAVIVGGGIAGSNTRVGLKQGVLAGAFSGLFLVLIYQSLNAGRYPAFEVWFPTLHITASPDSPMPPPLAGFVFLTGLLFGTLGGWMGASLVPPLVPRRRLVGYS